MLYDMFVSQMLFDIVDVVGIFKVPRINDFF